MTARASLRLALCCAGWAIVSGLSSASAQSPQPQQAAPQLSPEQKAEAEKKAEAKRGEIRGLKLGLRADAMNMLDGFGTLACRRAFDSSAVFCCSGEW